jgi:hypothetical protein
MLEKGNSMNMCQITPSDSVARINVNRMHRDNLVRTYINFILLLPLCIRFGLMVRLSHVSYTGIGWRHLLGVHLN